MRLALYTALLLPLAACESRGKQHAGGGSAAPAVSACAKAKRENQFAWIHDDYPAALACAKEKNLPLVVDLWAPWCHTCLSMQQVIFNDPSFAAKADKFVFVAIDTDRDQNAQVVEDLPLSAWPTFYVVNADQRVLARFVGGASVPQFHAFLDAGARAFAGKVDGADAHLLAAERAISLEDWRTADKELTAALAAAPAEWPRRADALVSLINAKHKRKDTEGCVALAEQSLDQTGKAASASDFSYHALGCATELLKEAPEDDARKARVLALRERVAARLAALTADATAPLSIDDRSDAFMYLRETQATLGKIAEAKATAEQQRALLDDAVSKALAQNNAALASTYNWPRAEVYVFLERPLELAPSLEQIAKALPEDYDPPARLGWIYLKGGKLAEAAQWTEASLKLAYGPRKGRVLAQRAEIAQKAGDKATEKKYREQLVAHLQALPASQTSPEAIAKAKQAVLDVDQPPPPVAAP